MRTDTAQPIRLQDYRPPDWLVETVELDVSLHPTADQGARDAQAQAQSGRSPRRRWCSTATGSIWSRLKLDGAALPRRQLSWRRPTASPSRSRRTGRSRSRSRRVVDPSANTQLSGLYRSSGTYCTQCEAEGFRRITYFLDRPDVMAVYTHAHRGRQSAKRRCCSPTAISSRAATCPDGRHFAVWHDPYPEAVLSVRAGRRRSRLRRGHASVTMSGRDVALRIYVEPGKEDRCGYAMDALKRSMRWDEEAFGREYDLDIFMIVAVSDFNMGAMENKGLNVFNDKYVLAIAETATDADFAQHRGGDRARIFPQLDRQPHHLPRLVPALPEGRADGLPRPGILRRSALARRSSASPTCAVCARSSSSRTPARWPIRCGPSVYQRDQQLLHRDRLREGRRGGAHDQDAARRREFPRRHGPVFRAPRRRGRDRRAVRPVLRRCERPRPRAVHALVLARPARRRSWCTARYDAARQDLRARSASRPCRRRPASRASSRW